MTFWNLKAVSERVDRSAVRSHTLTPVWNEVWQVKHVPTTASLSVVIRNKHYKSLVDHYIGRFETTICPGAKEAEIQGHWRICRGTFWIKVTETLNIGLLAD